jgi:hypothetical protein
MTQIAAAFYLQTQRYWRARAAKAPDLAKSQGQLEDSYQDFRVRGEVLETLLGVLFTCKEARIKCHGVKDISSALTFQIRDKDTIKLRQANAAGQKKPEDPTPDHSGLTVDELSDAKKVLDAYHERLSQAISFVHEARLHSGAGATTQSTAHWMNPLISPEASEGVLVPHPAE